MLDPKLLRSELNTIAQSLKIKGFELNCDEFLSLEAQRKALQLEAEAIQQERNAYAKSMGKLIGQAKANGEDIEPLKARGEALKKDSTDADAALALVQGQLDALLQGIPNIPDPSVPEGQDEEDNIEVRRWGTPKSFDFEVKDHVDLGANLGGLDFDTAAKITGSRFAKMSGSIARLTSCLNPIYAEYPYRRAWI